MLLKNTPIPPGRTRVTIFDTEVPGYVAEIGLNLTTLAFKFKEGRVQRQTRLGHFGPSLNAAAGRRKAAAQRALVISGAMAAAPTTTLSMTLEAFVEKHFAPYKSLRKRSWDEDLRVLRHRILPLWGGWSIDSVSTGDVQSLLDSIVATEGRSRATANRHRALLRHLFEMARRWQFISRNPVEAVDKFEEPPGRERVLSPSELAALSDAMVMDVDPVGCVAITFLLATGARSGEVLQAKWGAIDLNARTWRIPTTKNGRPMTRHLSGFAAGLLERLPRSGNESPIFPSQRSGVHRRDLQHVWGRVCTRAGIQDCRIHDLRHCFASILANKGESQYVIQKMLGHRSAAMTQRYSHILDSTLISAADVVGDELSFSISVAPSRTKLVPET